MLSVLQQLTSIITPVATKDGSYFSQMTAQKEADAAILRTMPSGSPTTAIDIGEAMGRVVPIKPQPFQHACIKCKTEGWLRNWPRPRKRPEAADPGSCGQRPWRFPSAYPKNKMPGL